MSRKKILVIAYQLSPYRGSEYSVAWNYVAEMSKEHHLTVLYGCNREHMGEFDTETEYYEKLEHPENIKFIPIPPGCLANFFNSLNRKKILVYSFYLAYYCWHKKLFRTIRHLLRHEKYDLIHFLGPIGYREPGFVWKLPVPYIWGPISGFENSKPFLLKAVPIAQRIKFLFRSVLNGIQQNYSIRVRKALKRSDVVLAASTAVKHILKEKYDVEAEWIPENGICSGQSIDTKSWDFFTQPLELIWIGRLDANKALNILLDALHLISIPCDWHLRVIGGGPLEAPLKSLAVCYGIDKNIFWHGQLSRSQVKALLQQAHCHIITSCMEGNPTVLWEAMEVRIPTISLDHCGMHDTICEKCGIKIPLHSYTQITQDIADAIQRLACERTFLKKLSDGTAQCCLEFTWGRRHEFFNRQYEKAMEHFKHMQEATRQ